MALYPAANLRLLPENQSQARIVPTQVILHSAVDAPGDSTLYGFFNSTGVGLESHFFVKNDGRVEEYMDTTVRADANLYANGRAISIETEDDGDPNRNPWTPAQVDAIVTLVDWLCTTHDIPRVRCPAWDQPGIGYHSMWGAPSNWTPSAGKTCPGTIRITQFNPIVNRVAAMGGDKGVFMALSDGQQNEMFLRIVDIHDRVTHLTPFPPVEINRVGREVPKGTGTVADLSVKWQIEDLLLARKAATGANVVALAAQVEAVKSDLTAAVVSALADAPAGTIDVDAVASAVIAKIKEKL